MQVLLGSPAYVAPTLYPRRMRDGSPELATWIGLDGALVQPQQVRLRSLKSKEPLRCLFYNSSKVPATIIWLDFCGAEVAYGVVGPNERFEVGTYTSHPWIARSGANGDGPRLMIGNGMTVFPNKHNECFTITEAPVLPWSLQTHKHFPASFRSSVASLLMAHHTHGKRVPELSKPVASTESRSSSSSTLTRWLRSLFDYRHQQQDWAPVVEALPLDMLVHVISFMAPLQRQSISLEPNGHPDILPVVLPSDVAARSRPCLKCGAHHGL